MPAATTTQNGSSYLDDISTEDLLYEEELLRNPFSLKMWWRYLEARRGAATSKRHLLYERALKALPGSYKLWKAYLSERRMEVRGMAVDHPRVQAMNNTYERALVTMHKMPRVWLDYLEYLMQQFLLTRTRRAFDRALCSLPITQHDRVWQLYLKFVMQPGIPVETAMKVYRRYLKIEPLHTEEYIAYLKGKGMWGEAAKRLSDAVNDELFRSLEGKSKHQLWLELCDIITKHPSEVSRLRVDAILRSGIRKFTDEVGRLWTSLADYYIRQGMMEKARDVYEEGLNTVTTVRDFSLIFDTLTHFEESLIAYKMQQADEEDEPPAEDELDGDDFILKENVSDLDLRLARLDFLIKRRPELLSSVMLRQNPHNVHEWHKRVKLFDGQPERQIKVYAEAVATVDPDKAIGKPFTLWCAFARFYERHNSLENGRIIFDKATAVAFKYVDDLASVWCEYAEMELRHQNYKNALNLLRQATAVPPSFDRRQKNEEREGPVQGRLYRSTKLWLFYCDLEESLGTLESTRAVYDKILELRIATPQVILNYALFLQDNKYFEDSFQIYERGIALFKWPHVKDIWQAYLTQFVERYKGSKLERARDLFKQALEGAPPKESKVLFLQYAALEENYGLARSAMEVYDKAIQTVPQNERLSVYNLYLARASDFFGIAKVREIYETAIEAEESYQLTDSDTKTLCLRYAKLETDVGEVDRARAIYVHGSSLANPAVDKPYWQAWNDFEVMHGNEDTFREMRRIMRSVNASFSQTHFNTAIIDSVAQPLASGTVEAGSEEVAVTGGDSMAGLEAAAAQLGTRLPGFVSAGVQGGQQPAQGQKKAQQPKGVMVANPEDIDLDEGDDDDEEMAEPADAVEEKAVPDAVFQAAGAGQEQLGALDRFAKRRKVT